MIFCRRGVVVAVQDGYDLRHDVMLVVVLLLLVMVSSVQRWGVIADDDRVAEVVTRDVSCCSVILALVIERTVGGGRVGGVGKNVVVLILLDALLDRAQLGRLFLDVPVIVK